MQLVLSGRIQVPPCWLSGAAGPHLDLGMQAPSLVLANSGMQTLPTQPLHQLSHQSSQSSFLWPPAGNTANALKGPVFEDPSQGLGVEGRISNTAPAPPVQPQLSPEKLLL